MPWLDEICIKFGTVDAVELETNVRAELDNCREILRRICASGLFSWEASIVPLEHATHELECAWSAVRHFHNVMANHPVQHVYLTCRRLVTQWQVDLLQSPALLAACDQLGADAAVISNDEHRRLIEDLCTRARLEGSCLDADGKARLALIKQELARLETEFFQNVLSSTAVWRRLILDREELRGLPSDVIARAASEARKNGYGAGWLLRLDDRSYQAVLANAESEKLRKSYHLAWIGRASTQCAEAQSFDNAPLVSRILELRQKLATLVGYPNYAEYSTANKMAQSVRDVEDFLLALVDMFKPLAEKEFEKLCHFAGKMVKPWDIAYYAERLRLKELKFTQEMLRPYFPLSEVLRGMFEVAERLFGVSFVKRNDVERYHPQVDLYEIEDLDGSPRGAILFDLHARRGKRGHAWVEPLVGRNGLGGLTVLPLASLVCNFGPNDPGSDTKLTHNEVVTLFHEFGHALHHCLTTVDYPSVAGFNAVPWDIIELPSQLFENYAWQDEVLSSISASSGAGALPRELMKRIAESRKFHAGLQALRQLEIALFDLTIHTATSQDYSSVLADLAQVRCRTAIVPYCDEDRFPNSFLHVFAGSYAAGYYSYKWAEVLASDVFAAFIENGIFDRETATRFSETILTKGGSRPPLGAFVEFRGRMPSLQALLEQAGMQFTPVT